MLQRTSRRSKRPTNACPHAERRPMRTLMPVARARTMLMDTLTSTRGFTLIELVVVVVIIAILAAIAVPRFAGASERARFNSTHASLDTMQTAFELYNADHRAWPEDAQPGVMPVGMAPYIQPALWANLTPLGGVWDYNGSGGESLDGRVNISIYLPHAGTAGVFCRFDAAIDNNDCNSGQVRASDDHSFRSLE